VRDVCDIIMCDVSVMCVMSLIVCYARECDVCDVCVCDVACVCVCVCDVCDVCVCVCMHDCVWCV